MSSALRQLIRFGQRKSSVHVRKPLLNLRGFPLVNPWGQHWELMPSSSMKRVLDDIFSRLGVRRFESIMEFGCGDGTHYSRML